MSELAKPPMRMELDALIKENLDSYEAAALLASANARNPDDFLAYTESAREHYVLLVALMFYKNNRAKVGRAGT